jgi:hypothetical protein
MACKSPRDQRVAEANPTKMLGADMVRHGIDDLGALPSGS